MFLRRILKVTLSLMLTVFLVASLFVGCVSNNPTNVSSSSTATVVYGKDEKTTITMWAPPLGASNPTEQQGDWYKQDLIPAFNKEYPNITVDCQLIPWDGIAAKVSVAIASKTTPDVYWDYGGRALPYGTMGLLEPLNDMFTKEQSQIFSRPDIMKMCSVNGKIVIMPFTTGIIMLLVNKTLWADANALNLLPQDEYRTWTPDQFKAALKAVANPGKGVYGITLFALNEQGDQLYNNIMAGFGVKLFNDDYSKYIAGDNSASVDAMTFFKSLIDEGLVNPHPESLSSVNALDYFKQGKNGMVVAGAATIPIIKNGLADGSIKAPFDYEYVNFPSITKGQSALKSEIGNGCVFKGTDAIKTKWAKKFLYWAYNDSDIVYNVPNAFNVTGKEYSWVNSDKELQFLGKVVKKVNEWPVIDPGWGIKGYPEMRAAMFPEMQQLFINKTTPAETIKNISTKFNDIIAKYNK